MLMCTPRARIIHLESGHLEELSSLVMARVPISSSSFSLSWVTSHMLTGHPATPVEYVSSLKSLVFLPKLFRSLWNWDTEINKDAG